MKKPLLILGLAAALSNTDSLAQPWSEQTSGVSIPLTCACAINNENGWICGFNGTVLRTWNTGGTWTNVSGNGIPVICQLITIYGIDSITALTAGNTGSTTYLFRTSNGGASWTQVHSQTGGVFNTVWFTSSTNGFLQGDPVGGRWSLWRTTNGGVSWDSSGLYLSQSGSELGWSNSFCMTNNHIWFGTDNTRIYYSSTSGTSWNIQSSSPELVVRSITFDPVSLPTLGFAGGAGLLKTTNGGTNWSSIGSIGSGFYVSLTTVRFWPTVWLARGANIYVSGNSGMNWSTEYTAPSGNYRHISQFRVAITSIWAVRDNGGISWRYFNPTGIKIISGDIPDRYSLFQNYPNPFNISSKFKVQSPKLDRVNISVYDICGRKIAVLVDEILSPGTYEIEFDGTNYPSGVYFYRLAVSGANLLTAGEFIDTKRMVLVK